MEESYISEDYLTGFNQGYYIQQNEPELIEKIQGANAPADYLEGFSDGGRQSERERIAMEREQSRKDRDLNRGLER